MLQNKMSPYISKPVSITPTLIICQGKFGRAVGIQLAARLLLMEAALRRDGFTDSLIARVKNNNEMVPGLVRIMELNWERWLSKNLVHAEFLQDIEELQDVSVAQKDIHRFVLEPDTHQNDVTWVLDELPKLNAQLRSACLPLRLHDTNIHKGVNVEFRLRLIIVCAARETGTTKFTHDLVKTLGNYYITGEKLTSGIQMFCYVGGTSLEEHISAGGLEKDYTRSRYELPKRERRRVLGRRDRFEDSGLPEWLMFLWNHTNSSVAHMLETCYLLDAHLANRLVPMPGRSNEPDEVVVATALALMSFIATDGDLEIRQAVSQRWHSNSASTSGTAKPGTSTVLKHCSFASFGVASYSVDHPKLHWLVHSWLMGDFLRRALPPTKGELNIPGNPQDLFNDDMALQIQEVVREKVISYQKSITFEVINKSLIQNQSEQAGIDFAKLVDLIDQKGAGTRQSLQSILVHIRTGLHKSSLEQYFQDYKRQYSDLLIKETRDHSHKLYYAFEAPLTSAYHFVREVFAHISHQTDSLSRAFDLQNAPYEQQLFADQLEKIYQQEESLRISALEERVRMRPTHINTLARALLIVATAWVAFPLSIPLFLTLGFGGGIALALGSSFYAIHSFTYRQMIRRELVQLARLRKEQLRQMREYAHRWALVEFRAELEDHLRYMTQLCEPGGLIATLRNELLRQDLVTKDHTLERLFLDDQLKQDLKQELVDNSIERFQLWNRREQMLSMLADTPQKFIKNIEGMLRSQVEVLYQGNVVRITDIISRFLSRRNTHRLDEIYRTLSDVAVPYLQYTTDKQDDSVVRLELFGVYGKHEVDTQDIVTQYPHIHVMNSVDKLYWLFMRVHVGIHFDQINFSIATIAPP